ncbi:serine/threonine-protein kinase [Pseudoclavibacter sp. 13-3]|uniref:serine/threonine-protein kinase n=1 Tax=Pseudoclavibacter sp. 13-3 TaxID=2901228 RepID=UPI001E3CC87E|nr:serine/threonine-protein kinase [Pseudoclavibacter sp. 13-3]MCD7101636.1 serine/threonine protein kinase [Pseudoclavibacter sp. 13-3]
MGKRLPSAPPALSGCTYVRPLGTGGFADVFLFEQDMPRRPVAVKVLLSDVVDEDVVRMFNAEADVMARLSSHPAILNVYQASIAPDGRPYLVMEYCPTGVSPAYREQVLSLQTVLDIAVRMGSALETAHRAGVLHRDIKPSNILFTSFGTPVLADFGIATSLSGRHATDLFAMSVPWSAPEVVREQTRGTIATEVYSLAATVYTLLAGHSPFEIPGSGRNSADKLKARIVKGRVTPIGRDDVPTTLQRLLMRSLSPNPSERPATALEFAREIQQVQQQIGVVPTQLEVASSEWAGAGSVLGFDDAGLRGPKRAAVPVTSERRRHSRSVRELATQAEVVEDAQGSSGRRGLWIWAGVTAALVVIAVAVTVWVVGR